MSFHHTATGMFGGGPSGYIADRDGYVHTSVRSVRGGYWGGETPDRDRAAEIAGHNRAVLRAAKLAIAEWQGGAS